VLCPAWKKYGTIKWMKAATVILRSRADEVVHVVSNNPQTYMAVFSVAGVFDDYLQESEMKRPLARK
jgi:hypothetical protein